MSQGSYRTEPPIGTARWRGGEDNYVSITIKNVSAEDLNCKVPATEISISQTTPTTTTKIETTTMNVPGTGNKNVWKLF